MPVWSAALWDLPWGQVNLESGLDQLMVVPCMAAEPEQLTVEEGRRGQIKKKKKERGCWGSGPKVPTGKGSHKGRNKTKMSQDERFRMETVTEWDKGKKGPFICDAVGGTWPQREGVSVYLSLPSTPHYCTTPPAAGPGINHSMDKHFMSTYYVLGLCQVWGREEERQTLRDWLVDFTWKPSVPGCLWNTLHFYAHLSPWNTAKSYWLRLVRWGS